MGEPAILGVVRACLLLLIVLVLLLWGHISTADSPGLIIAEERISVFCPGLSLKPTKRPAAGWPSKECFTLTFDRRNALQNSPHALRAPKSMKTFSPLSQAWERGRG